MRTVSILFVLFLVSTIVAYVYIEFAEMLYLQALVTGADIPTFLQADYGGMQYLLLLLLCITISLGACLVFNRKYSVPSTPRSLY